MAIDFEKLVKQIVVPLVMNPNSVLVKVLSEDDQEISIQLLVDQEDIGRVIGKGGRIASAIRTIIYAGASKEGRRVNLDIDTYSF